MLYARFIRIDELISEVKFRLVRVTVIVVVTTCTVYN